MAKLTDVQIALMDKSRPLTIRTATSNGACVLRGCPLAVHDWIVEIPGAGKACLNCADDHGWETVDP